MFQYSTQSEMSLEEQHERIESVKTLRIFMTAIVANLLAFTAGTAAGWTSPIGPKLRALDTSDSPLSKPIGQTDDSLLNSLGFVGTIIGPFLAGYLADQIGRKRSLLCSAALYAFGYVLMLVANEIWIILLGRFLQGFGAGFVFTVQPMYIGEISTDNVRGATSSFFQIFLVCGVIYVYSIGPYVSYYTLQYACLAVPIAFITIFTFMPESPYYFVGKGRKSEALKSLQFLRGQGSSGAEDEIAKLHVERTNKGKITDIFRVSGNRKAFTISLGLMIFQHLTGITVMTFNYQTIFESAKTNLDPAISAIVVAVVQLAGCATTPLFVDRLPRKTILLTSSCVMTISLAILGAYFYIKNVIDNSFNVTWLPLVTIVIYNLAYFAGFGPVPWAILAEIFPAYVKSIALSVISATSWAVGFLVAFAFPLLNGLGPYYAIWLFAVLCAASFFFTLFVVIETKGLSLLEIQEKLHENKCKINE